MAVQKALIIGPGGAGTAVMNNMEEDGRAKPVAFVEARPERRAELAERYPDALIGDENEFAKVLAESKPDIVVDAGPDYLHAANSIAALEAGCHVLIEKPMATGVEDAKALLKAEKKAAKVVMVDYTMRYSHPWGTMMSAAKNGDIGDIFYLGGFYVHDMFDWYDPAGKYATLWRINRQHPQNILFGGGCHGLDMMLVIMDDVPVTEVYCVGNQLSGSNLPEEDCYQVSMKFKNGVVGQVFVTTGCNRGDFGPMLEVYGQDGTLVEGKLLRRGEEPVELAQPKDKVQEGHGWNLTVRDFLDAIDGKMENQMNTTFGARNVAICEAAIKSLLSGKVEKVEWIA